MARLDTEEAEAQRPAKTIDPKATLTYLADLPRLWRDTAPERHRGLAEGMFERIELLGTREAIVHRTPEAEAHGWRDLWGNAVLTADYRSRYGRGERDSACYTDLSIDVIRLAPPPTSIEDLSSRSLVYPPR